MNLNIDLFNKYIFNNKFYTILGFQYQKANMEATDKTENYQTDIYLNSVYISPSGLNFNFAKALSASSSHPAPSFLINFGSTTVPFSSTMN